MEIVTLLSRANEIANEMLKVRLTKKQKEVLVKYLEMNLDNLYGQLKEIEERFGKNTEVLATFSRIVENLDKRISEGVKSLGQVFALWNAMHLTSMLMFFLTTSPNVFISTNLALLSDFM